MSDGRQRLKQKRYQEELERERKQQLEEEKRLYVYMRVSLFSFIKSALLNIYATEKAYHHLYLVKWKKKKKKSFFT